MRKEEKRLKCTLIKWIGLQYREEVHVNIQRQVRYLLWDNSETKRQRKDGGLRQTRRESRMKEQAVRTKKHTSGEVFVAVWRERRSS